MFHGANNQSLGDNKMTKVSPINNILNESLLMF